MNTITKLALSNDKQNKIRSILATVSIVLTMTLLTVVASFGYGIVRSERENAGLQYGDYYGVFQKVNMEQLAAMQLRSEFTEIGLMASAGISSAGGSLCYADEQAQQMNNLVSRLKEGRFPARQDEIAASVEFFQECGIEAPEIGEKVQISSRLDLDSKYKEETFLISGIMEQPERIVKPDLTAFISKDYYEGKAGEASRSYTAYFKLDRSISIDAETGERIVKELAEKCGIAPKYASDNYAYLMWAMDPGIETLIVCTGIILVIIIFSVMVIYNIFQVGIAQKIQEYGKVRALGATKRQMRRLIWREGMLLAFIGIPVGLLCGILLTMVTFRTFLGAGAEASTVGWKEVSPISPFILAAAAFICFLTVWISLKRPMRMVSSISPVEAMRYQEAGSGKTGKGIRRGRKTMSAAGLMMARLSGEKKRTAATVATMGLSCVLFVAMANFAGNMDAEFDAKKSVEFGAFELSLDYSMNDTAYPENNLDSILRDNPMDQDLVERIGAIEGVTKVWTRKILLMEKLDGTGKAAGGYDTVEVLSREEFEWEQRQGSLIGDFSYDSVTENGGILFGWSYFMGEGGAVLGETQKLRLSDGTETITIEPETQGAFGSIDTDWAITEDTYQALGLDGLPLFKIWVDCAPENEAAVKEALSGILADLEHIEMDSYEEALRISKMSILLMKEMCYSLSIMIAVISFLNMANTLVTSVITRKQEFGMLQAIGMTNAQLNRSLQGEGLFLTVGTVLVAMAVGVPCGYAMFWYGKAHSWIGLYEYHFPVIELALMVLVLTVFQLLLSFVLTRNLKKESLIERIRYQG